MIGDTDLKVSKLYGMLPADTAGTSEGRTPANNATVRNVFIIGPDKLIKLLIVYPMTTGRNFDEIIRVIDSMQLTAKHKVATPVNWKQGDDVIINRRRQRRRSQDPVPGLCDAEALSGGRRSSRPEIPAPIRPPRPRTFPLHVDPGSGDIVELKRG